MLNDSLSWTEEIARYGLMWVTFIGGAVVTRKKSHIAVELLSNVMGPGPLRRTLLALIDVITLGFLGLLAYFSVTIIERMHAQRMTVFDLPMSIVYGGVGFGCFLMFGRQAYIVWRNARDGWRKPPDPPSKSAGLTDNTMTILVFVFIAILIAGRAGLHRARGLVAALHAFHRRHPGLRDPAPDGGRHRQLPAAGGAVLHPRRQPDELAGITNRIYDFAVALAGWMRGGLAHVNIIGSVIFAGMSGTAIADAAGLGTIEIKAMKDHGYSTEFAVGVTAASATLGPIIPPSLPFVIYGMMANVSIGALFLGGVIPGVVMTLFDDGLRLLLRAQLQHGPRPGVPLERARDVTFIAALPGAADARASSSAA